MTDIINILGVNQEKAIQESVVDTIFKYQDLTIYRTCKIFSGEVTSQLRRRHIVSRYVDTADLGYDYSHCFNIIPAGENEYYVIDLTYRQFQSDQFQELRKKGYTKMDSDALVEYIETVGNPSNVKAVSEKK